MKLIGYFSTANAMVFGIGFGLAVFIILEALIASSSSSHLLDASVAILAGLIASVLYVYAMANLAEKAHIRRRTFHEKLLRSNEGSESTEE